MKYIMYNLLVDWFPQLTWHASYLDMAQKLIIYGTLFNCR